MFEIKELIEATGARLATAGIGQKVQGISIDSRTVKSEDAFIAIEGDNFDGHRFIQDVLNRKVSVVIVQRNKRPLYLKYASSNKYKGVAFLEVQDTVRALGDIARFHRKRFSIPIIALTGSNGKTTAKDMVAWVLSRQYKVLKNEGTKNNHIGLPMTLLELTDSHDIGVLEAGTNHFGEVAYLAGICQATVGIITNIGPSHLEFFKTLQGVLREKYSLIDSLKHPALALLNGDDVYLGRKVRAAEKTGSLIQFGIAHPSDFRASDISSKGGKLSFKVNEKYTFTLNTLGYYNIYNALAAIAVARVFGIAYATIIKALADFTFPKSRLQLKKCRYISVIDDSYNSNPLSLRQALEALRSFKTRGRKIFIMGDMLELGDRKEFYHTLAGKEAARVCDVFVTVGMLSRLAAAAARKSGFDTRHLFSCGASLDAKRILFNTVTPCKDDIVLIKGSRGMRLEQIIEA